MTQKLKTLSHEDAEKIFRELLNGTGTPRQRVKGIRNYVLCLFMLDAGLRVGETTQLLQSDLFVAGTPVVALRIRPEIAKNKAERTVPLSKRLQAQILTLASQVWGTFEAGHGHYAFFRTNTHESLTTRQIERILRKASLRVLGRPIHPHVLRHTFASRLSKTVNLRVVQELLGHSSITSTQIYTHPDQEDMKKAIETLDSETNRAANGMDDLTASTLATNDVNAPAADRNV